MTQEQKRIKIAEARGWTAIKGERESHFRHLVGIMPDGTIGMMPDYFNDLNAMHEAEKHLTNEIQECQFCDNLFRIMNSPDGVCEFDKIHATAAQRAEAFGKTLGLW